VRALVISDLHLGAWTGDPVLSRPFARGRIAPLLDEADELVLNGDTFDFLFSTVGNAFAQAEPFFDLVAERMRGGRVTFLAGNHDHHVAVRGLRAAVELQVATGATGRDFERVYREEHRSFLARYLERKLPGIETEIVYPAHEIGDSLICHGHYLDAHMGGSLANRVLTHATWTIAGGRPLEMLCEADYEAVIVPLTELLFTVAQLPRGTAAQQSFQQHLESLGRWLGRAARIGAAVRPHRRRPGRPPARPRLTEGGFGRACSPIGDIPLQLAAYGQVVRTLGWDRLGKHLVFSHTHQPLAGVTDTACGETLFWNTGSWIYEPTLGTHESYVRYLGRAWPGTAIAIDDERSQPRLVRCLSDQSPLAADPAAPDELRAGVQDHFTERAARYEARLARRAA